MKPTSNGARRGLAIPIVLTFVVVVMIFSIAIGKVRTASKFGNLITFHYLKANYMAQSGIQHAMMKIRVCPDEAFEAAARQFGLCPLNDGNTTPGTKNNGLMDAFMADLNSTSAGNNIPTGWGYRVTKIETKAAVRKANQLVTLVEITCDGWADEGKGGLGVRHEIVTKTVSIFKKAG